MQLPIRNMSFNKKQVEIILKRENKYITDLLSLLPLPNIIPNDDGILLDNTKNTDTKRSLPNLPNRTKTSRATSLVELQQRLDEMSERKRLNYKEKLLKKNIKTKIKRKGKQGERNAAQKLQRFKKESQGIKTDPTKEEPSESNVQDGSKEKIVFSKFDFSNLGKQKHKKEKYDPKKALEDLQKQKDKLEKLNATGETDKAIEIKEKSAWKNAIAKAQGEKVRDDAGLLAKSIKKRDQKLRQTKKKWKAREDNVQKLKDDQQKKREENINKRKKDKKLSKMKKSVKRGKIIPGF